MKPWNDLKLEQNLTIETYIQWLQIKHVIPHNWKTSIGQNLGNASNLLIQDHHLIKGVQILTLKKLSFKELYSVLINLTSEPSSNIQFEKTFPNMKFSWRKIYILLHITTTNMYLCSFQYKILNKILFLNKRLFVF